MFLQDGSLTARKNLVIFLKNYKTVHVELDLRVNVDQGSLHILVCLTAQSLQTLTKNGVRSLSSLIKTTNVSNSLRALYNETLKARKSQQSFRKCDVEGSVLFIESMNKLLKASKVRSKTRILLGITIT